MPRLQWMPVKGMPGFGVSPEVPPGMLSLPSLLLLLVKKNNMFLF